MKLYKSANYVQEDVVLCAPAHKAPAAALAGRGIGGAQFFGSNIKT